MQFSVGGSASWSSLSFIWEPSVRPHFHFTWFAFRSLLPSYLFPLPFSYSSSWASIHTLCFYALSSPYQYFRTVIFCHSHIYHTQVLALFMTFIYTFCIFRLPCCLLGISLSLQDVHAPNSEIQHFKYLWFQASFYTFILCYSAPSIIFSTHKNPCLLHLDKIFSTNIFAYPPAPPTPPAR